MTGNLLRSDMAKCPQSDTGGVIVIDLTKYRVIDLSYEMVPGERKINGKYLHGEPLWGRPIEVQEFIAYEARMHFIQGQTHTGTHAEAPYKYSETAADVASMPVEQFLGEAAACNFTHKRAGEGITPEDFQRAGVKPGDIVLAWGASRQATGELPHMTNESIRWLIDTKIKLFGCENLHISPPGVPIGLDYGDAKFLAGGVALVDALLGLDQIKKPRVFFMAIPPKLRRVTATWIRAIALEEI
jgi:kynurenine formamidase